MNRTIKQVLEGREENHVLPFFWQHGEDEQTLREMMAAIHGANCGAVCVESRPHPDFCGDKWWADMDVILDEARKRGMKVWILDDSHFPTGYANGAVLKAPEALCKQAVYLKEADLPVEKTGLTLDLRAEGLMDAPQKQYDNPVLAAHFTPKPERIFGDDRVLRAALVYADGREEDVTAGLSGETLTLQKAQGAARLRVLVITRNAGYHRHYINLLSADSVRLLIDAVYEPHWQHYAADFGKTIAGFFSDEPELGNGAMYEKGNTLGKVLDLPWSAEMEERLPEALGADWQAQLERLWRQDDSRETARVHAVYMDLLTRLVRKNFSEQLGNWCRDHGVQYIGHMIEDDGQHCHTGSSLAHYFRGLQGEDMSGIDDIGGQVLPQGEDIQVKDFMQFPRSGTFYHYGLGKLAQSAAAIDSRKQGRAMCEIFGNYGWEEGVRLEKYLADHFLVRGINYFVPHAFTGKDFPDPDCPPHFYAHGHNPQYRHFGELMKYMNRVATLTSSGRHRVPVAVLYHGEAEWCDPDAMPSETALRALYDRQADCHILPADVFTDPAYRAEIGNPFWVNGQAYQVFVVPGCRSLCADAARGLSELREAGLPVIFAGRRPDFISETGEPLPELLADCQVVETEKLAETVARLGVSFPKLTPANDRIRLLDICGDTRILMAVNEGTAPWSGTVNLPDAPETCFLYDAWANVCLPCGRDENGGVRLTVEPLKSLFIVAGDCDAALRGERAEGEEIPLKDWTRSTCEGAEYPNFGIAVKTSLPDGALLAEEQPEFSGFVRYDASFALEKDAALRLRVDGAEEGVEVFLNGESQGIQIAPPFVYDLSGKTGENHLRIEVATTLERECYPMLEGYKKMLAKKPSCASGITGKVTLRQLKD